VHAYNRDIILCYQVTSIVTVNRTAGYSGTLVFYTQPDEICFSDVSGSESLLAPSAIKVAAYGTGGQRWAIYAYDQGSSLADSTPAVGKRLFFGLYDDTFRYLSASGLELWDAAINWLVS
jgi:hypothetical protein